MHKHAEAGPVPGFNPGHLAATLRAVALLPTPAHVDQLARLPEGTARGIERGERCSCHSAPVLRWLLWRAGFRMPVVGRAL